MLRTTERIASEVRATAEGQGVGVLKEGFLLKRSQKGMVRSWDRRYFTLNSLGVLHYQSAKVGRPHRACWAHCGHQWLSLSCIILLRQGRFHLNLPGQPSRAAPIGLPGRPCANQAVQLQGRLEYRSIHECLIMCVHLC